MRTSQFTTSAIVEWDADPDSTLFERPAWWRDSNCHPSNSDLTLDDWIVERGASGSRLSKLRRTCRACPTQHICLRSALAENRHQRGAGPFRCGWSGPRAWKEIARLADDLGVDHDSCEDDWIHLADLVLFDLRVDAKLNKKPEVELSLSEEIREVPVAISACSA